VKILPLTQRRYEELKGIRDRINLLRVTFASRLTELVTQHDFSFIPKEKGMFSFLGVNKNQIQELINEYAIYLVDSSRINVASINDGNIDYVTESISKVISRK
jgi:Aspartate/tyrosine/aromatic aminotransferase